MKPSEKYKELTGQTGLYNIQSIDNISSIMRYGLLSNEKAASIKHTSIAMSEIQERRENVFIPNGMALHRYANLYFDPRNPMLFKRQAEYENICILKFDCSVMDNKDVIVSDRNASSKYASFHSVEIGLDLIDFDMVFANDWRDENQFRYYEKKSKKCAEVLVPFKIPFNYVISAAVYDETSQNKLLEAGFDRRIFIKRDLYFC